MSAFFVNFILSRLKILKPYFTRILGVQIYAKLQGAKEIMFLPVFVCLFVCLFVCESAR